MNDFNNILLVHVIHFWSVNRRHRWVGVNEEFPKPKTNIWPNQLNVY